MYRNTNNPLLLKDDVGRAKPPVHELPSDQFIYGFKPKAATEGVKESCLTSPSHPNHASAIFDQNCAKGLCQDQPTSSESGIEVGQGLRPFLAVSAN